MERWLAFVDWVIFEVTDTLPIIPWIWEYLTITIILFGSMVLMVSVAVIHFYSPCQRLLWVLAKAPVVFFRNLGFWIFAKEVPINESRKGKRKSVAVLGPLNKEPIIDHGLVVPIAESGCTSRK
jgi:hypothetical protein